MWLYNLDVSFCLFCKVNRLSCVSHVQLIIEPIVFSLRFRHVLNTCIDPPHEGKVISMEFQPGTSKTQRAMSASIDGKFKIWIVKQQHDINGI